MTLHSIAKICDRCQCEIELDTITHMILLCGCSVVSTRTRPVVASVYPDFCIECKHGVNMTINTAHLPPDSGHLSAVG